MAHSDPDLLAMMAMSEPVPAADIRHVESCEDCRSELRSLRRVAELARSGPPDESFTSPSPMVWTRITGEIGIDAASLRPAAGATDPTPSLVPAEISASQPVGDAAASHASRAPRRPRRRSRPTRGRARKVVAGVVGVAVVAAALTITVVLQRERPVTIGEASLDPLVVGEEVTGDAVVRESPDGMRDIDIALEGTDAAASGGSYREVWLLSSDSSRLVSLGVLEGSRGNFVLPDSIDLDDYPVVDVSVEPLDGDPAHSGVSIVRGALGA